MPKIIISRLPLLMMLSVLVAFIIYLQIPKVEVSNKKNQRVVTVKTITANLAEFKDVVEALGTTIANEQVLITSKYSALVDDISFQDGQMVKKGDVLISLSSQEEAAKVEELQANLAESVAQLNRFVDLHQKKATSIAQVEQQEAKTKAIAAQLLSAKAKLNDLTIKAPFSGKLGFRKISVGALVDSGDTITSLDDLSKIKVDFSIPEYYLTTIKIGQIISAQSIAYKNEEFTGKITAIDSRIDNITRTLKVRAEIPNLEFKLRAGMLLNINVVRQVENVLQVPESAVIPVEKKHFVFVVEDNKAKQKMIVIGRRQPGIVEVITGISQGEHVVIEGALKLRDGSQVNVLEH